MKKLLPIILLSCNISPLCSMDKTQRIYPLLEVMQTGPLNPYAQDEQARLLTHDLFEKDRLTLIHATPPPYQDLYISEEESKAEIEKLTKILAQTEKELATLPSKLPRKLKYLTQERAVENMKSNAMVSSLAFCFYFTSMWLEIFGDPRGDKVESLLPFLNNTFGWMGSEVYSLKQCTRNDFDQP